MPTLRNSLTFRPSVSILLTVRVTPTYPHRLLAEPGLAYRGHARVFLKNLEAIRPSAIIDIIHSGESFMLEQSVQKGMKSMRELLRSAAHRWISSQAALKLA